MSHDIVPMFHVVKCIQGCDKISSITANLNIFLL